MLDPDEVAYYELFANSAVFIFGTILKGYFKVNCLDYKHEYCL